MPTHTFQHEAMATYFEVVISHDSNDYARQAATACWREVDQLENELSRFVETSDIARANRLACDQTIPIGDAALECLLIAADVSIATGRAFDAAFRSQRQPGFPADLPPFTLDPENHTLTSRAVKLGLDLGAVGKGFAVDRLSATLREWQIGSACVNSGGSTVLAWCNPEIEEPWRIGVGDGPAYRTVPLDGAALSASGTAVKGAHLIDPRSGQPVARTSRVWALAPTAAQADALSTAFFVMTEAEIAAFCTAHPQLGAALVAPGDELIVHGALRALL